MFRGVMHDLGFPHLVCGVLRQPERYGKDGPLLIAGFPEHWLEHYYKSGYDKIDPMIRFAGCSAMPFRWSDFTVPKAERRVLDDAAAAGLHHGLVVPIHGPAGDLFCASLATDLGDAAREAPTQLIRLLTVQFQSAVLGLQPSQAMPDPPRLSPREAECLTYCAIGKTNWEIGRILNISEKTVEFHLTNAMAKLEAGTRVLAVVKAIRFGMIAP
ncbi:autoinducer binding domain-containing protein [Caenispirillum salinarum]|uniref:helix-turn-helix transcriptional regulator n=1 Tax=Caenispirillum salinarum TaxID=859058 RepID=UPI00384C9FD6